jgi:hypothetical protein
MNLLQPCCRENDQTVGGGVLGDRGERGEHRIEADADSRALAAIGIDRVGQPGGEYEERSNADCHHDLVGVVGCQLRDRRADDGGFG